MASDWNRDYIYLNGQLVARVSSVAGEGVQYVINDHLGTPMALVDSAKIVRWKAKWYPFGEIYSETVSATNDVRFPGQLRDEESGLFYNWHRYYNPRLGRYYQADPLGLEGGDNLFVYAGNNPLYFIDPFGLSIGAPGTFESMISVWGSARQAINDFQTGHPFWGAINVAAAVSDVFLVKSLVTGVMKGAWLLGGHSWRNTKRLLARTGRTAGSRQEWHHIFIPQGRWGKNISEAVKNQPFNLMPIDKQIHDAISYRWISLPGRLWHGTPSWTKFLAVSAGSRAANAIGGPDDCR